MFIYMSNDINKHLCFGLSKTIGSHCWSKWKNCQITPVGKPQKRNKFNMTKKSIWNVKFRLYFLISDFPEKLLTHFRKFSSIIMKLTRT